jgi:hypothetical protein
VLQLPPVVALTREQIVADVSPTVQRYLMSKPIAASS